MSKIVTINCDFRKSVHHYFRTLVTMDLHIRHGGLLRPGDITSLKRPLRPRCRQETF